MMITRKTAIDLLKNNPYKFGKAVGFSKLTNIHNSWIKDMVFGTEDETLQAHRGSYKTTSVSVGLAIICILYPNDKTMFMRKTDGDVKEIILQVQKILNHPVTRYLCNAIWGVDIKLLRASTGEITTNLTNDPRGTAQLVGMGINGSLTGKHYDRVFTDDIVNVKDRVSKAEREHTKLIYQELHNIVNRGGRIFNTGTPWHKEDCFTLMPNPEKWDCYSTGLIDDETLSDIKESMLPSLFAANYELRHIASEDVIFANPNVGASKEKLLQANYTHVDAAYTDGGDYTALTIIRKYDGKYYVYGRMWQKAVDTLEDKLVLLHNEYKSNKFICERNGDKGLLAKELRSKFNVRVETYHEDENKFQKIVTYLKWAWRNIYFVEGTDSEYIQQILDYNEYADHDDAPDSLASAVRKLWNHSNTNEIVRTLY